MLTKVIQNNNVYKITFGWENFFLKFPRYNFSTNRTNFDSKYKLAFDRSINDATRE